MIMHEQHVMQRTGTDAAGAEEWQCPACGRRLLLQQAPVFTRTVLAAGDELASHSGGLGGAQPGRAQAEERAAGGAPIADDDVPLEMLRPWLRAFKAIEEEGYDFL